MVLSPSNLTSTTILAECVVLGQNFLNAANLSCSTNFKSFDGGAFRQAICKNSETTPSQLRSKSIIQPPLIGCWWLWFSTRLRIPHPEHPPSRQAILDNLAWRKISTSKPPDTHREFKEKNGNAHPRKLQKHHHNQIENLVISKDMGVKWATNMCVSENRPPP